MLVQFSSVLESNRILNTIYEIQYNGFSETYINSGGERNFILKEYISEFGKNPFFGFGYGLQAVRRWDPHNSIVEILGKTGLFGLSVFLLIICRQIRFCIISLRSQSNKIDVFFSLYFLSLLFQSFFTGSVLQNLIFWFIVGANEYSIYQKGR